MDATTRDSAVVDALRLGFNPQKVRRFSIPVEIHPETLLRIAETEGAAPLLLCLHPARQTEFQFAHRLRGLRPLKAHLAFPRALHAHEVDLGGARTVGYAWCHYTGNNPSFHASLDFSISYLDRVMNRIFEDVAVDRRSIYVIGAEEGAMMGLVYALRHPEMVAGLLAIDGYVPQELLSDSAATLAKTLPVLCLEPRTRKRMRRTGSPMASVLEAAGFDVDRETIPPGEAPEEEEAAVLSWLTRKAGVPIEVPT